MSSIYPINKGVNRPVVFRGLQSQYIWWLAGGLVLLLLFFAFLYVCGIAIYLCLVVIVPIGLILFSQVYRLNNKYGEYGLMKMLARKQLPKVVKHRNRIVLNKDN